MIATLSRAERAAFLRAERAYRVIHDKPEGFAVHITSAAGITAEANFKGYAGLKQVDLIPLGKSRRVATTGIISTTGILNWLAYASPRVVRVGEQPKQQEKAR